MFSLRMTLLLFFFYSFCAIAAEYHVMSFNVRYGLANDGICFAK